MAVFAMSAAQPRGFTIAADELKKQIDFTIASFRSKHDAIRKGQGVGGANTTVAYALVTLSAGQYQADETTAALIDFLLARQREDGAWPGVANRPPSEGSPFTSTALALQGLRAFGDAASAGDKDHKDKREKAMSNGRAWLLKSKAVTTEDVVFRLRGLVEVDADRAVISDAAEELLKSQKQDGGWSQLPELARDAYATGSALVALRRAGLPTDHIAMRRGVRFLLDTQKADGSWFVETRSKPVQVFFDNGDPGGKSQFISMSATGWATLALLESLPIETRR
jgi:N-acyl-D-amino-acid deacylase